MFIAFLTLHSIYDIALVMGTVDCENRWTTLGHLNTEDGILLISVMLFFSFNISQSLL